MEARYDIGILVSDEHQRYSQATAPSRHLLCTTHFEKNKLRRVRELKRQARSESMKRDLEELEVLLKEAPEDGKQQARQIYSRQKRVRRLQKGKPATVASKVKQLALEIYEKWERVWEQTNNQLERSIGQCLKIRSKQMRGYKVEEHIRGFAKLRGWMYSQGDRIEMGCLV